MARIKKKRYSEEEIAAARQRDAELTETADTALADPDMMAQIAAWLTTVQPTIRARSLRNATLLFKQAQQRGTTVTDVRSFRDWIAAGRCPLKGTNYRIVAPRGEEAVADDTASDTAGEAPGSAGEEGTTLRTRFRMVPVWDIADTTGIEDFEGEAPEVPQVDLWERLTEQVQQRGYTIRRADTGNSVDHESQVITIADNASPSEAAAALGVQLAAVITHQRATKTGPAAPAPVELPPGVQAAELTLDGSYGSARVTFETNWTNGRTRYQVTAKNVTGTLTVMPERHPTEPTAVPETVDVTLGDFLTGVWPDRRDMFENGTAPVVNGVNLTGGVSGLAFDDVTDVRGWRWRVRPDRYLSAYCSTEAPERTADRFRAVLRAVLLHWFARTDLADVRLAAARDEAPGRIAERNREADKLDAQIVDLQARRAQVEAHRVDLAELVDGAPAGEPVHATIPQACEPSAGATTPVVPDRRASFFPTPAELAERLIRDFTDIGDELPAGRILEPNAGDGALVTAIRAADPHAEVVAVEPNATRAERISRDPGIEVITSTFEDFSRTTERFAAVVMNPPFTLPGQPTVWIDHVREAWRLLAPGGRLVAIVPAGYEFRNDRRHREIRQLVEEHGGQHVDLGDDAFATSGAPGIRTVVISVDKPPAEAPVLVDEPADDGPLMLFA